MSRQRRTWRVSGRGLVKPSWGTGRCRSVTRSTKPRAEQTLWHHPCRMRGVLLVLAVALALIVVQITAASDSWTDADGDGHGAPDIRSLYLQDNWTGKKGLMS